MHKFTSKIILFFCIVTYFNLGLALTNNTTINKLHKKPWSTSEHLGLNQNLKLYFDSASNNKKPTTVPVSDILLELDNGLELSFAEIVMLSGDYFAVGDQPITGDLYDTIIPLAANDNNLPPVKPTTEQLDLLTPRFINAFSTLSVAWDASDKALLVYKYLEGILSLEEAIALGMQRYDLAVKNYDHFSPYSWYAYTAGHNLAVQQAIKAGHKKDKKGLEYAYAVEAFAQHFLTDAFSAGHVRVPIKQLQQFTIFEKNALLLTKFMHDEDSKFGLNLYNKRNDYWRAYGDDHYLADNNTQNRKQLEELQQLAIAQVYHAYNSPSDVKFEQLLEQLQKLMPIVDQHSNSSSEQNTPLFSADDNGNIYRRTDINRLKDPEQKIMSQLGAITMLLKKLMTYDPS